MPFEAVYKCDECGRQRQEANHWFVALIRRNKPGLHPGEFVVRGMQAAESAGKDGAKKFLCGEQCLMKALSSFVANTLTPAPVIGSEEVKQ